MAQDTLWNECEDQDLDAHSKARVEELLANPQFLAWLDQQEAEGTCPSKGRHGTTRPPYRRGTSHP